MRRNNGTEIEDVGMRHIDFSVKADREDRYNKIARLLDEPCARQVL